MQLFYYPKSNFQCTIYHLSNFISHQNLSPTHSHYALPLLSQTKPKNNSEASQHECWKQALQLELLALEKIDTWNIVDLPLGVTPIGCRWVYKIKYLVDGSIKRLKGILVAKWYNQIEGLGYFDTYSLVVKFNTIIALASFKQWNLHQLDINNTFLHGGIQENVYMTPPPGVSTTKPN